MDDDHLPILGPATVVNDEALSVAVDAVLVTDPSLVESAAAIREAQEALRAVVDDLGWDGYLWVEELHNCRLESSCVVIARWAFSEGVRIGARRRP